MKKLFIIPALIGAMFFTSCEDFLDVNTAKDSPITTSVDQVLPVATFYAAQLCYDHAEYGVYLSQALTTGGKSPTGSYPYSQGWEFLGVNRHPMWRRHFYDLGANIKKMNEIADGLAALGIRVQVDDRDNLRPGFKFAEYELKGVPVRLALGQRDLQNGTIEVARRDTLTKETVSQEGIVEYIAALLDEIQANIFQKALSFRDSMITKVDTWDEFVEVLNNKGGFISAHWDGTPETEQAIKDATKATIRCIPIDAEPEEGKCIFTGKPSHCRVLFAKSY